MVKQRQQATLLLRKYGESYPFVSYCKARFSVPMIIKQKCFSQCVILVSWRGWSPKLFPIRCHYPVGKSLHFTSQPECAFWVLFMIKPRYHLIRLKQWFSAGDSVVSFPTMVDIWQCLGTFVVVKPGGVGKEGLCYWWVKASNVAKHPAMHSAVFPQQRVVQPQMSVSPKLRNQRFKLKHKVSIISCLLFSEV